MYILLNFIIFPFIFWIIGLLLKLRDKNFKVLNAVLLGLFLATIITLRKLLGMN